MKKFFNNRINILLLIIVLVGLSLILKLADLQIVHGEAYREKSELLRTRKVVVEAPRGNITDKYGRVMAGNSQNYSIKIVKMGLDSKTQNEMALYLSKLITKNGDEVIDDVPIDINPIKFRFKDDEIAWMKKNRIPMNYSAEQAFAKLRLDNNISPKILDVEAYDILKNEMGISIPFDLYNMEYNSVYSEIRWKKQNSIPENATAEEALDKLFENLYISKTEYSLLDARKILSIRYLLSLNKYKAFEPVEISKNVTEKTRAEVEENRYFLPGVEVVMTPVRNYPYNKLACHILGYMGRIGEEVDEELGYQPDAMVGKSGIEDSMESYLKGKNGEKQVEVDVKGNLINTVSDLPPTPGNTVFLTIDLKLQKIAEEALKKNINDIRKGIPKLGIKPYTHAYSGSVVAMEINTGKILAMVSIPEYDPNLFSNGISSKNWEALQPTSDSIYAPRPLVNIAISSPQAPASTMKMVSALAGLQSGAITVNEKILDRGLYTAIPGVTPSCLIYKLYHRTHGYVDVSDAIKSSCNFFFFEVGRRMGGATFEKYAKKLGFGDYTGIELPNEYKGRIEGPESKLEFFKAYLKSYVVNGLKITNEANINEIIGYLDNSPGGTTIRKRMKEMGFSNPEIADRVLRFVTESAWMPGDVLNAVIGQGMDSATTLQMATCVSTLVNGGTRYKPYIVDKIVSFDGETVLQKKPEVAEKLNMKPEYVEAIKKGMYAVTNEQGGTASSYFTNSTIHISGKTGTAEAGKYRPDPVNKPDYYLYYDNHGWFVAFAPYDKPKIAIAINVLEGGHGNYTAPVAISIIEAYLAPKKVNDKTTKSINLIK